MPNQLWLEWGFPATSIILAIAAYFYARHIARDFDKKYGRHDPDAPRT